MPRPLTRFFVVLGIVMATACSSGLRPAWIAGDYALVGPVSCCGSVLRIYDSGSIQLREDMTYTWTLTGRQCNFGQPCGPSTTVVNTGAWTLNGDSVTLAITNALPAYHNTTFGYTPGRLTAKGYYDYSLIYERTN
jgi:hypothetical protein